MKYNLNIQRLLKRFGIFVVIVFLFINVIAAFHAYKFTHFSTANKATAALVQPTGFTEKLSAIFFGITYYKNPVIDSLPLPNHVFHLTTTDGVVLEGWYAAHSKAKGTVILFHGHGGNRVGVATESMVFYDSGYNVCMADFRAHGNSTGNTCTIGYREAIDVKTVYDFVKAKGDSNVILWGVSLGAASIMKAMAQYNDIQPSKIILQMPFGSLSYAVKGRLRIMGLPQEPFSTLLTFWGSIEQGFWAFDHKPYQYATHIRTPVLLQWGQK